MSKLKVKGSLLVKQQTADIVSLVILEFKETFKNIDLETLKDDYFYVQSLMESLEKKFSDKKLFEPKNLEKIDKNDVLMEIVKGILPHMTKEEEVVIQNVINLIIGNQLIKKRKKITRGCINFLSMFF